MSCAQQPTNPRISKLPSCHNSHRKGSLEALMHKELAKEKAHGAR